MEKKKPPTGEPLRDKLDMLILKTLRRGPMHGYGIAEFVGRDHEDKRHGTVSLLAGMELLSGEVLGLVRDRHRSAEFIEFLQLADQHYTAGFRIRIVLD